MTSLRVTLIPFFNLQLTCLESAWSWHRCGATRCYQSHQTLPWFSAQSMARTQRCLPNTLNLYTYVLNSREEDTYTNSKNIPIQIYQFKILPVSVPNYRDHTIAKLGFSNQKGHWTQFPWYGHEGGSEENQRLEGIILAFIKVWRRFIYASTNCFSKGISSTPEDTNMALHALSWPTEPTLNTVCPKIWVNYIILPKFEEQNIQEMETSCCSRFVMLASDALNCACSTQLQKFPKLNDKVLGASFGVSHLTCKENRHRLVGKDLFFCHGKNGCNNKCRAAWCAFACRYCWEEALLEIRRIQMLKRGLCELVKA